MKNYNGKLIKEKSLIFNLILILSLFMLAQVIGIITCFKFFSHDLTLIIASLLFVNFVMYKIMRRLFIL
ncbi:hypothetical protein [Romboutsia sp.]|uniref:hypothetical protein n=1 Tax=Romboutsia sp. TaxID=1965302 RepID=UPI003F676730